MCTSFFFFFSEFTESKVAFKLSLKNGAVSDRLFFFNAQSTPHIIPEWRSQFLRHSSDNTVRRAKTGLFFSKENTVRKTKAELRRVVTDDNLDPPKGAADSWQSWIPAPGVLTLYSPGSPQGCRPFTALGPTGVLTLYSPGPYRSADPLQPWTLQEC